MQNHHHKPVYTYPEHRIRSAPKKPRSIAGAVLLFAAAAVESGAKRLGHRVTKSDGAEHTTDSKRKPAAKAKARQRTSKAG